ncbi:MAG: hypothetical protein CSA75_00980 [Sorangium cellulosum]|nr:MAG: hypothetical protein CSA75_00980 [Sorangium cellulosum]
MHTVLGMYTSASHWHYAFRRLVTLAEHANVPIICDLPCFTPEEIKRHFAYLETRYGVALPPSYRAFLTECDGCQNLFRGAKLLSLKQLLDPLEGSGSAVVEDLNTPIPSFVAPDRVHWRDDELICIGLDQGGDIVFVLDPASVRADGEMEVIAWIAGLGVRLTCFAHLLEFLGDLMDTRDLGDATPVHTASELAQYIAA